MAASEKTPDQFLQLFQRFMLLRPKLIFPDEHVSALHEQVQNMKDSTGNSEDRMFLFRILAILDRSTTPPTMGELSADLGIPLSSATRMADGLVEAKFVERCADQHDRRVVRLCITDNGQQLIRMGMNFMRRRIAHVLKHLSADEQKQLLHLLNKLIDSVEAEKETT